MKKYLKIMMGVLAVGLAVTGCTKDVEFSESDAVKNAEKAFGVTIDPEHDWNMSAQCTANITVDKTVGETYTVTVYANNPYVGNEAYVLAKGKVANGQTFTKEFSYASALTSLFVGLTDSRGFTTFRAVPVDNGFLRTTFGKVAAARRSQAAPSCPDIEKPYDEAWVTTYLATAKEPNSENIEDNYDHGYYQGGSATITTPVVMPNASLGNYPSWCQYNQSMVTEADIAFYNDSFQPLWAAYEQAPQEWSSWGNEENYVKVNNAKIDKFMAVYNAVVTYAGADGVSNWLNISQMPQKGVCTVTGGSYVADETYVLNFKITGTWDGGISVAASEGDQTPGCERTIVVTGTWNVTDDQRIGSRGKIIIANGGTLNVADGKTLNMVNQARLVVLPGGKLTGAGKVEVNNGNAEGLENYNGGIVDVAKFNNNFGKFHNYGQFLVNEYWGGAQESNFYNHGLTVVDHFGVPAEGGSSANARVFNACQYYVNNNARIRNYEGIGGSALIVSGELMFSSSEDGTSDPTYVGLASGALVKCGTLYNNGTSWTGPTAEGEYAVVSIGQITYLNWAQDTFPLEGGYFENNIYVEIQDDTNVPDGNGMHLTINDGTEYYTQSTAAWKFWNVIANGLDAGTEIRGNGGVTKVVSDSKGIELIPADSEFSQGVKGCTPGYRGAGDPPEETENVYCYAFEDTFMGDYDMNDVVLYVWEDETDETMLNVKLMCSGASFNLFVCYGDEVIFGNTEVHSALGCNAGKFVNTGHPTEADDRFEEGTPIPTQVRKPSNYSGLGDLDFWIKSPQGDIHVGTTYGKGKAPYGIIVPFAWKWPTEWTKVSDAYPDFAGFAENRNVNKEWYNNPASGKTW